MVLAFEFIPSSFPQGGRRPVFPKMEQCLRLLRSNSDEEKFVGLYLVTKLKIKTADPSTGGGELVSALRLVWDAIGITFLQRMLRTTDQSTHDFQ